MASANGRVAGIEPARRATRPRREHWRALIEECRRSGVSQAEFCRRRGIRPHAAFSPTAPTSRSRASVTAR
jgi:hypothetical protein